MSDSEPEVAAASTVPAIEPSIDPFADGDWICLEAECKNVNFARRTACNRCNTERVLTAAEKKKFGIEIGKAAADKSRGLFSAEDWQCSKCANVNWARRNTCNMCNAPKFIDVEERTGYGGGYNDRGVVEYKEHREASDDEYDEFGRRKKKRDSHPQGKVSSSGSEEHRRKPSEPVKEQSTKIDKIVQKAKVSDDEDEDDEDDDDADLSKYDLWGDDEDDDETETREKTVQKQSPSKLKAPVAPESSSSSGSSSSSSSRTSGRGNNVNRSETRSRSPRFNHKSSRSERQKSRSSSRTRDASYTKSISSRSSQSRRSRSRSPSKSRPFTGSSKHRSRSDYSSKSRSPIHNNSNSKYAERARR